MVQSLICKLDNVWSVNLEHKFLLKINRSLLTFLLNLNAPNLAWKMINPMRAIELSMYFVHFRNSSVLCLTTLICNSSCNWSKCHLYSSKGFELVFEMVKCIHVWRQGVEYNTPFKYRAFIVSNEDAIAKLIHDMHCKIINTHQRLNKNIDIFSEKWIK